MCRTLQCLHLVTATMHCMHQHSRPIGRGPYMRPGAHGWGSLDVHPRVSYPINRSRRVQLITCAATKRNLYEVLGVSQSASDREIKSAYRKKAIKLHPDVNKAPDAQQQFMEAKMAYETLSDASQRAEYDRRMRMGFGSASDWQSRTTGSSSYGGYGSYGRRPASQPEDNYSFEDLLRDLDKEFSSWTKSKEGTAQPKSLLEELAMLGEEFVDFLEDAVGAKDSKSSSTADSKSTTSTTSSSSSNNNGTSSSSSSSSQSSGRRKSPIEEFDELWSKYGDALGGFGSKSTNDNTSSAKSNASGSSTYSSSSSSSKGTSTKSGSGAEGSKAAGAPRKPAEDDIEAQLAALKKKVRGQ